MRSERERQLLEQLLERLCAQAELPTAKDLAEVEELLERTEDIPLSEREIRTIVRKVRELDRRRITSEFCQEVGQRLAWLRRRAGLDVGEAADRVRLTRCELQLVETGQREPFFSEVVNLAKLYDISTDELLRGLR